MPISPRSRWFPLASAALLVGSLAACEDPFEIRASVEVVEDTLVVFSLSDTTIAPQSAVALDVAYQPGAAATTRQPVARRLGPDFYSNGFGFDVAIDVQGDSVVFVPPRHVATQLVGVRRIGLRVDTVSFDSPRAASAPRAGYAFDTVAVAAREGQTVFLVTRHPVCELEISKEIYAKVGVVSIDRTARTATLRVRVDPNCGFRSFLPGVPRS